MTQLAEKFDELKMVKEDEARELAKLQEVKQRHAPR